MQAASISSFLPILPTRHTKLFPSSLPTIGPITAKAVSFFLGRSRNVDILDLAVRRGLSPHKLKSHGHFKAHGPSSTSPEQPTLDALVDMQDTHVKAIA